MTDRVIDEATFQLINDAMRVIKKLDEGGTVVGGSPEHLALTRAVVRLVDDHLISHEPLTGTDLAWAYEVMDRTRRGSGSDGTAG